MKLENQVCTLEQAKRLKELGVEGESAFYWRFESGMRWRLAPRGYFDPEEEGVETYSAFTVAELGVMLPHEIGQGPYTPLLHIVMPPTEETEFNWCAAYVEDSIYETGPLWRDGETEAQARSALLIHLLESGSITAEGVNDRLQNP